MTDEQIIKEYQEFVNSVNSSGKGEIAQGRFGDILDLIVRQKAEIESLKQIIDEQDKEVIKLQNRIIFWRENLEYQPEKIKSEAIKEFAEGYQIRIAAERRNTIDEFAKQLISEIDSKATRTTQKALLETIIEKAAKEMKGDNENERKTV